MTNCKGVAKHARDVGSAVVTLFYLSKLKEKGKRRKKASLEKDLSEKRRKKTKCYLKQFKFSAEKELETSSTSWSIVF